MVGSFLNVLIVRMPLAESAIYHRSHCRKCKKALPWYDLVPVLSFVLLSGKCRFCQEKISWQYPTVEILTAILFTASWGLILANQQPVWFLLFYLLIFAVLVAIAFIDLNTLMIPDALNYCGLALALLLALAAIFTKEVAWLTPLIGLLVGAGFIGLLVLLGKGKWMGEGDIFLAAMMGLILFWPKILVGLFLAFLIGSIVSLILIFLKKKTMKDVVPFGPFLVLGTLIALFFGQQIISWYLGI